MKKAFRLLASLLVVLTILPAAKAQMMGDVPQLPLDQEVRYGVLPNGLTYYIRHNEYPKGQADFYIAQKVGSILEEDNQRGLAHFLEHMCFNGTDNFPGNSLIDWLETVGVKFGRNLNAYTGVDQTVYNISNVPVGRESVQDSVLLILHDWADGLTLDPEEIDKERGVIHQEWRRSNVGQMRIIEQLLPTIYPGSKYGYRLPIGTMEVVDNFKPEVLRDYYETWYRPDQQGIIVVGDIDVDRIEGKIKDLFGSIKMPADAKPREYFPVPDHQGTIYAIGRDPEQQTNIVQMSFLSDVLPENLRNTQIYIMQEFVQNMVAAMLNERLEDISRDPQAPFSAAYVNFGNFFLSKTKDALDLTVISKTDDVEPALQTVYRELVRAARSGFTQTEYDRVKNDFLTKVEKAYNNRNTRENGVFVQEYVDNFIDKTPAPGIDIEYEISKALAQMLPLEAINSVLPEALVPDNRVVLVMQPEKEGMTYATEESIAAALGAVDAETIEAFVDDVKTEPLIPALPQPGKVVSETVNPQWDATEWTLSNGVKVLVKNTKFKEDEIKFIAVANGGTSVYPDSDAATLLTLPMALNSISLGSYTNADLTKYLKGKTADIDMSFDEYTRDLSGATTPRDLPYLMELIYAAFTEAGFDEKEFAGFQSAIAGYLANMELNPDFIFGQRLNEALYSSPRMQQITAATVLAADRAKAAEIMKAMMANAADYTFIFVGNVEPATLKPLVEQYIATLPADPKTAVKGMPEFIEATMVKGGKGVDEFKCKMETPQTTFYLQEWGNMPYTAKNAALASIAGQILSNRLLESVREREGAVYSIGASGYMRRVSPQNTTLMSSAPMTPDKRDLVLTIVEDEINSMAGSVKPEELKKAQEYMVKTYKENLERNDGWLSAMGGFYRNGVDNFNGYDAVVSAITVDDVAAFMRDLNAQGNYRVVVLDPEQ